ncbi:MAG TPA: sensor histidine kinase [Thermomicrobiales bacterium]|nr:sensor histidine kinase [Thermomicrobiales bacterium]
MSEARRGMGDARQVEQLNSDALAALADFEGRVATLTQKVEGLRNRLDVERRRLSELVETLGLNAPGSAGAGALDVGAIRAEEQALGEQLLECSAFASKMAGLHNLLAVSRSQFAPHGEASEELDVWKLVARTATIRAQEEERHRLAREVHDGPAQVLANAILGLELCEQIARRSPEQVVDEIGRLKAMVREGLVEVRRFIFDLRPSTLADRGLLATLERYIADYRAFFHLDVEVHLPASLPPLTQEEEIALFRIVQESLQNIQKHARATLVAIRLEVGEAALRLTIADNGRGFVAQQIEVTTVSGVGLRGMAERAAAVGGELQVESQPGAGATIRLMLPRGAGAPGAAAATRGEAR